jgi:hypothetical protein
MKLLIRYLIVAILLLAQLNAKGQFNIEALAPLSEASTNGAVETAEINGNRYVYYWAGIDSSLIYSGINRRGFRYSVSNDLWESLHEIPDSIGKIALSATRIGDIIYLIGGYSVSENGNEISSNKVHRFSVSQNAFLTDAATLPTPIDDHIQFAKNDSLIYVITGWSNSGNTGIIQVYNVNTNTWQLANNLPSTEGYNAFGAAGTLIGDTIYYFGGASDGFNFPTANRLRKGFIHPENPYQIDWQSSIPNSSYKKYRAAGISVNNKACFIGGSSVSYNFNGISYAGSVAVSPSEDTYILTDTGFVEFSIPELPMDVRSYATIGINEWIIVGGLIAGPAATSNVWKLTYTNPNSIQEVSQQSNVYPNPASDFIYIRGAKTIEKIELFNSSQMILLQEFAIDSKNHSMTIASLPEGFAFLKITYVDYSTEFTKVLIHH